MTQPQQHTETWPGVEVAFEGTNLSPADVPLRHLIELLEATTGVLEAIAEERGGKMPPLRLLEVRSGSAAFDLRLPDTVAVPILDEFAHHIESRGAQSSHTIRRAIERLHRAGKPGSVRLRFYDAQGNRRPATLHVAPPLEVPHVPFDLSNELYARVVGVTAAGRGDKLSVKLRSHEGTHTFTANQEVASAAAKFFLRQVRAEVDYEATSEGESGAEVISIELFEPIPDDEFLDELDKIRVDFAAEKVRASDWLRELE